MSPLFLENDVSMRILSSFCTIFFFLYIGHLLRENLSVCRRIMLPASMIGGIIALAFVQLSRLNTNFHTVVSHDFIKGWEELPEFLMNIVFASLFLGEDLPSIRDIFSAASPQICYGWFLAFGNWAISCLLTGVLFVPVWKTDRLFSTLGPVGFTGGHGTAGGFRNSYEIYGFTAGGDLALTSATFGILSGLFVGTFLVNVSDRAGWTFRSERRKTDEEMANCRRDSWKMKSVLPKDQRKKAGMLTVSADSIETLSLHLAYISLAVFLAYWTKRGLVAIEKQSPWLTRFSFFTGFPVFPLAQIWSIVIQYTIQKTCKDSPLDKGIMDRISGTAIDVLVLSALATTNISAVATQIAPLIILCSVLVVFQVICFMLLAPRMLPDFWVERASTEFGLATGTTSIGLILLRSIDPELETPVANCFGSKQLFSEPFLGGGLITSLMFLLVLITGNLEVFAIASAVMAVLTCIAFRFNRTNQKQ